MNHVETKLKHEVQKIRLQQQGTASHFVRSKNASVRGTKKGAIEIMRCQDGGFIRVPKSNSRLKLARILEQFPDVSHAIDKYKSVDRSIRNQPPLVPLQDNTIREKQRREKQLIDAYQTAGNALPAPELDLNGIVRESPLMLVTRSQLQQSRHPAEVFDSKGNPKSVKRRGGSPMLSTAGTPMSQVEIEDQLKYRLVLSPTNMSTAT